MSVATAGVLLPQLAAAATTGAQMGPGAAATSLLVLSGLGAMTAHARGAPVLQAALHVVFWDALAKTLTARG